MAKQLLSIAESTLLSGTSPSASQRVELIHAIRSSLPSLKDLLSYPPPRSSDRAEVQSKEVRLPDAGPMPLDDQDVQIALKLSDVLHLNEIECVRLLVSANQEWGLLGREPSEIFRLAAGLWYTERRDLLTALYTLLRAVVLDQGLEADLVADIQSYLENLIRSGLRQRLISLIKELRQETTGLGEPSSQHLITDSRGALVDRKAVISRERLILSHCLVLSILVDNANRKDIEDIFSALKESAADCSDGTDSLKQQITYSLLFSIVIAFISDALSTVANKDPVLCNDASFRHDFSQSVMASGDNPVVEGFVDCVRLVWLVHLILVHDGTDSEEITANTLSHDIKNICSCLEVIFANNVFQFWLDKILRTAAFQNDDEDMIYMYNAYLHKLMTCFLSHPLAKDKVKEAKEKAMTMLSPYRTAAPQTQMIEIGDAHTALEVTCHPFVSLLEFVSEIYKKEPELLSYNDYIWTFVKFAGEDHTNFQTLVAFMKMLRTLACSSEGASKVFELLHGKTFRSIGWSNLFDCLSIYEEKFKHSVQSLGGVLPQFQEGDAKALVAYLDVLEQVVRNGSPTERRNWFPDIEPLFKLLSYENVPPYLKGALRNAIAAFVHVSPIMKDRIWRYLEQYDLPVVVGPNIGNAHAVDTQVYDMRFELDEIEARREQYPSTISFINLLNTLIAEERDNNDRGRRFIGIFRFISDHVFGPYPQRAYADPCEKWQLVISCLEHFHMMLSLYDIGEEDSDAVNDQLQISVVGQSSTIHMQLPILEIMKDFMSGKILFRNIMGIILPGVNHLIMERTSQIYGHLLEKAVLLSLEIIVLVMEKDSIVSDFWRPLYEPLDVLLSQDHNQIIALLEYVRYDFQREIQLCSIKIFSALSSRMVGLAQLLLKSNSANSLIEDYAACLELRSEESQIIEDSNLDSGVLLMQLLIENISKPAPNITHLLLRFNVDSPVECTVLQPKFHYSCLKVILDILDKWSKPDTNALLHEFGFQLLYELCADPLTSVPTMDLLSTKKYQFFVKHLGSVCVASLPERSSNQALRISSLHQRAWLLKLLAVELHTVDISDSNHREACQSILLELFGQKIYGYGIDHDATPFVHENGSKIGNTYSINKNKVFELLELVLFQSPDVTLKSSQFVSTSHYSSLAEDILTNSTNSGNGIYYHSERGDRLIDLASFRDRLWQKCYLSNPQLNIRGSEAELNEVREAVQQLLRWGWKYNKNLEEQAAQLHLLMSWCQIVEVSVLRRISFLENQSSLLFQLLDASLSASASSDCSLKMAQLLTQVALTCMAKLRDERFAFPGGLKSDMVTYLDVVMPKQLPSGACHSILFKLIMAILRHESSEALRRRQYALLLSYFQYCQHMVNSDVSTTILQLLSVDNHENDDSDLEKIDKDQAELAHTNFAILRKEDQAILNLVIRDASQGNESLKLMALYVLDVMICVDHEKYFLSQLQSRGFLRACLLRISSFSYQDGASTLESMQRLCTLEAELSLLLRISNKYGKSSAQVLFSMGSVQHVASCSALHLQMKGNLWRPDIGRFSSNIDKLQTVLAPVLRFVLSMTSLVKSSEFFEVKNKVVREIMEFIKSHRSLFDQIFREDLQDADESKMELTNLVVDILTKVWSYEESDEYGFVQGLFGMMRALFSRNTSLFTAVLSTQSEIQKKAALSICRLCFSLSSYLCTVVTKKSLSLPVSDSSSDYRASAVFQLPTLSLLVSFLGSLSSSLERTVEEKYLLLQKIKDINELSRQEVDEAIQSYVPEDYNSSPESIQKRRYIAMMGMCRVIRHRSRLIMLLLIIAQNLMNVILAHFQDSHSLEVTKHGTSSDAKGSLHSLCGELIPVLEKLESLSEDKSGLSHKVFRRLIRSLKEVTIQKLGA